MTAADNILTVDHLTMRFGGLVAIGDVSFQAKRGDITALIGPNGAGKTTVFNCITGFYKPTEGMLTLTLRDGQQYLLERLPGHEINAKAKVARTFQNIRLFSGMTVLENLLVAQHNKLMKASGYTIMGLLGLGGYKEASAESIELAKYWLDKADLTKRADDPAGDLPYGDQRRLEIARAMCTGPELLCLDEPAAGLNPKESLALNTLLKGIKNDTSTSILLIEHDMSVVMQISDHVVVLEYGRKISDGDPAFVKSDPKVIAAYLGVDDEEVEDVLVEVGDEHVIEMLDTEPDPDQGPDASASMLAGPIEDTIGHSDPEGEVVRVDPGASRASLIQAPAAKTAAKPKAAKPSAGKSSKTAAAPVATVASAPKEKPVAKVVAAKPAVPAKPAAAKATVSTKAPAAKMAPAAKAPPKARDAKAAPAKAPAAKAAPAKTAPVKAAPSAKAPAAKVASAKAPAAKASPAKPPVAKAAPAKAPAAKVAPTKAPAKVAPTKPPVAKTAPVKAPTANVALPKSASGKPAPTKSSSRSGAATVISARKPVRTSNWLAAPRGGRPDDLLIIKGIGPVNLRKLNEHGIFHFDQIAAWTRADITAAEVYLEFDGRIDREDWIGQAKKLDAQKNASTKRGGK